MKIAYEDMIRAVAIKSRILLTAGIKLYQINADANSVDIMFDIRGRSAGLAMVDRKYGKVSYHISYNTHFIKANFEDFIKNIVPHEVAHILCFMKPTLGKGHDYGWASVCQELGGSADRCHAYELDYSDYYTYITTTGHELKISKHRHTKIQKGRRYIHSKLGMVNNTCEYQTFSFI